jgi:hypothetical protein
LNWDDGVTAIRADSSNSLDLVARTNFPVIIVDNEGGFDAVQYTTSSSAPGTLELTNADIDANGNDITDVNSLSTDEAIIANESVDRHQTHIETIDPSSATSAVTFSSVPSFDSYLLVFDNMILDAAGDLFIRFNGDGGGNGNYHWWDETGTKASGVDQIELVSFSSGFRRTGGTVSIDNPQNDPIGVNNDFVPAQANGIDGFAQKGGRAVNEDLSSIELRASGANIDDLSTVSLYGIVQS